MLFHNLLITCVHIVLIALVIENEVKTETMCLLFIATLHGFLLIQQGTWLLTELFRTSTWTSLQSIFVLHVTFSCTVMPWSYMYAIYVRLWQFLIIFDRLKVFFSNFCSNVTKCNKCHIYKNHRRRLLIMFGLIWRYYGMGTVTRSNAGWVC